MKATGVRGSGRFSFSRANRWKVWRFAAVLAALSSCGGSSAGSIGAVLGKRENGRLYVRDAPPGMAAWKAGLEPDDEIVAIDGHDVRAMTADDVRKAVRGDVGSTVILTVERNGVRRDVNVQRGPFKDGR